MAKKNVAKKENDSEDVDSSMEVEQTEVGTKEIKQSKSKHAKKAAKKEAKRAPKKDKSSKVMKIIFFSMIGILVVLGIIMLILSLQNKATPKSLNNNTAAASVNGENILASDLDALYNRLPPQTKAQVTKTELLDQMINEKTLMQEAKNKGLDINQVEISDFLDKLLLQSGITKQEFIKRLELQNITEQMVNDEIYKQLIITKLYQQEIIDKIDVSNAEIEKYYNDNIQTFNAQEKVKASHILICHKDSQSCESNLTKDEALAKITKIKATATKDNFADLAKENSQDGSAAQGGDLGFFEKGTMVKPFEDASFSTKVGQISDIVETQYGYHLILVTDKKAGQITPFAEVSSEIKQIVLAQKQQDSFKTYLESIKAKSKIDIYFEESIVKKTN